MVNEPSSFVVLFVKARLIEMRQYGNLTRLANESGISDATWRRLLNGGTPKRENKRIAICDYLGWTANSLDLLERGEEPVSVLAPNAAPGPASEETLDLLEEMMGTLRRWTERVEAAVAEEVGRARGDEAGRVGRDNS
ncbi:MAG TPA: hypothetical protein VHT75_19485 [Acidimicrobiales bacterium]|jgi:hypothetical protein|nr:hypothetical protein [Acidimicrobiales bacterium]